MFFFFSALNWWLFPEKCWLHVSRACAFKCRAGSRLLPGEDPMAQLPWPNLGQAYPGPQCWCRRPAMRLSAQFSIVNLIDAQLSASVVCPWCMYSIVRALVDLPRFFSWVLSSGLTLQGFSECIGSVFFLLHHFLFFLPECGHDV